MLVIHFEGWFQCRLAVNPDPSDEPRGISGYTFALAGEPDLDRIIRLQNPIAPRTHGPKIGVYVSAVDVDGVTVTDHILLGGAVDLLGEPRFESRNRLLSEDRGGVAFIDPFEIDISVDSISITRKDILFPEDPKAPFHTLPPPALNRRGPVNKRGMTFDPVRIADAVGITDATVYRAERRASLESDLLTAKDETERASLKKRIKELKITSPEDQRTVALGLMQNRRFEINGPAHVVDDKKKLDVACDTAADWPIEFWMGAWDADALCGFIRGLVKIPIVRQ